MQDELERWNGRYAAARERPEDLDAFVRELDEFTRAPDAPLELKRILSQAAQENLGLSADSSADVEAFERRAELALRAARAARERRTELWVEGVVARARLERGDARGALGALTPTPDDAANAGPELVEVWIATAEAQQRLGDLGSSVAAWERAAELSGRALGVAVATEDAASSVPSALPSDLREYYVSARLAALEALYLAWTARGVPDRAARALAEYDAMDAFVAREGPERATFGFQRLQLALAYRLTVEDPEGALAVLDELRALRDAPPEAELLQRFGRALVTARRLAPGVGVPEGLPAELDALAADERLAPDQRGQLRLAAVKLALRVGAFAHAELERRELETLVGAGALASSAWGTSPADLAALAVQIALARRAEPSELGAAIDRLRTTQSAAIEAELALPAPAGGTGRLYWPAARERLATCIEAELALGATVPSEAALRAESAEERAYGVVLADERLGSFVRNARVGEITLADVRRELLGDGAVLLAWVAAPERSHVFLVGKEHVLHATLAPRGVLLEGARALGRATSPPRGDGRDEARRAELDEAARRFAELALPAAFLSELAAARGVYVTGIDLFGAPTLELLPFGGSRVGLALALAYLPSASMGVALARASCAFRAAPGARDLAVVADPDFAAARARYGREFPALELGSDAEEALEACSPGGVVFLERDAASFDSLRSGAVLDSAMTLVFTHGVRDTSRAYSTGLALAARDGAPCALFGDDVLRLGRAPRCVVLFVCNAGVGPARVGDDTQLDLGGAFLACGSLVSVQSTSDLAFEGLRELAPGFARDVLQRGTSPAEALRAARAELARAPRWSHPFFHSTLSAHGIALARLPGTPVAAHAPATRARKTSPPAWTWWVLGPAGLVVALFLVRRRARST